MSTISIREKEQIKIAEVGVESVKMLQTGKNKSEVLVSHRNKGACIYSLSNDLVNQQSKIVKSFGGHMKGVTSAVFSPIGEKIITGSDNTVFVHDLNTKDIQKFEGHDRRITSVTINKDNNKIVSGSQDKSLILWNTKGKEVKRLTSLDNGHKGWVNQVEFIPGSDECLASCSEDGTVKIWDLQNGTAIKTFIDGKYIDLESLEDSKTSFCDNNPEMAVKSMCFSNDGSIMAYGGRNAVVYIINLIHNELLQMIPVTGRITSVASGENQPLIAVAVPNKILLWNIIENGFVGEYIFAEKGETYCNSLTFFGDEILAGLSNGLLLRLEISRN